MRVVGSFPVGSLAGLSGAAARNPNARRFGLLKGCCAAKDLMCERGKKKLELDAESQINAGTACIALRLTAGIVRAAAER